MPFWTYLLRCADGKYYTGHTDDLDTRLWQHQEGVLPGYTHARRPLELMWSAVFDTRDDAFSMEMRVKKWSREKKEALIAGQIGRLSYFSVPPGERDARPSISASLDTVPRLRSGRADEGKEADLAEPAHERRREAGSSEAENTTTAPIIVLVRPQLGENIGKAARAMLNFGLTELRLVAPRDGWPNPAAGPAASGADAVLTGAEVFGSVAEAVADCAHVYATTVRKRGVVKPVVTPEAAARAIRQKPGRSAILFGPERSGLESDDVALARTILTVPINPEFGSLNLAQAVILVAYEWSKGEALASPPATALDPPAPQAELEALIAQVTTLLDDAHYFFPPERDAVTKRTLRSVLTKPAWNANEVRTMRGIIRAIGENRRARD